jgi:hypothetical protein
MSLCFRHTIPPFSRSGLPECGEPTSLGNHKRGTGEPPQLRSQDRRFGADILCGTGRNRSTRSLGMLTRVVDSPPTRILSRRCCWSTRPIPTIRLRADRTGEALLLLGLVSHHETT